MNSSLSHIALLVPAVEASAKVLNAHRIETDTPEIFESEGTKEVYVGSYGKQKGLLLLLEAISEGPYKKAMEKRGPSVHHIAIDVLDVEKFTHHAQGIGWKLHSASAQTMTHKTAWLFLKGVPALIEVHQKKELSSKPLKVSQLELPIRKEHMTLFDGIGLGDIVSQSEQIALTVDGHKLTFTQIACLR